MPGFWLGHSRYEFYGHKHRFVADMHITENDAVVPITATLTGVVIKGWMKGARVTGEYTALDTCSIPTPGNAFGRLLLPGHAPPSGAPREVEGSRDPGRPGIPARTLPAVTAATHAAGPATRCARQPVEAGRSSDAPTAAARTTITASET